MNICDRTSMWSKCDNVITWYTHVAICSIRVVMYGIQRESHVKCPNDIYDFHEQNSCDFSVRGVVLWTSLPVPLKCPLNYSPGNDYKMSQTFFWPRAISPIHWQQISKLSCTVFHIAAFPSQIPFTRFRRLLLQMWHAGFTMTKLYEPEFTLNSLN